MEQGLHDHAILLRFLAQSTKLLWGRLRGQDIKPQDDLLEAYGHVVGYPQSTAQIHVTIDGSLDALSGNPHCCSNHLAGDLSAGRQSAEEEIAGTRSRTSAANPRVGLGFIHCAPDVD